MNDICYCDPAVSVRLFADDTNIFIADKDLNRAKSATENTLNRLSRWFIANQLTLNVDKTCFSVFSNKDSESLKSLQLNGKSVERVTAAKYLGVFVDEKLNWNQHIDHICKKLTKLTFLFRSLSCYIDQDMAKQLSHAYAHPYLTSGIELFGVSCQARRHRLQILQNKVLKILTQKHYRHLE